MSEATHIEPARRGFPGVLFGFLRTFLLGTLSTLSAPTSILLLGWLQRRMRWVALRRVGLAAEAPGWVLGPKGRGTVARLLGGVGANVREGAMAFVSLGLATLPFAAIWVLSWWAGWENSFSKGYEQAFVGPLLGFAGVAVFMATMVFLPLALAHQAVEGRALALFELRRVRAVWRETGWGYVVFAAAMVVLALPVFAGRGLVAFADNIMPGLSDMTPEEVDAFLVNLTLVKGAYVFAALLALRGWSARLYARAATAAAARDTELWRGAVMAQAARPFPERWRMARWLRLALIFTIWFGLAAQIFVAQFLNHSWWLWLTHPFTLLPMAV